MLCRVYAQSCEADVQWHYFYLYEPGALDRKGLCAIKQQPTNLYEPSRT